ncbi:YebG family protein [Thalassotalea piscium]
MAVESRYVVIRKGVEVETFMDKKAADEYDKMLDMADNLAEMFQQAPVELSEALQEELSIYLAQNRENVLIALQAKKPKPVKKAKAETKSAKVTALASDSKESDVA